MTAGVTGAGYTPIPSSDAVPFVSGIGDPRALSTASVTQMPKELV